MESDMTPLSFRDKSIFTQRPRRESTVVDTIIIHAMSEYLVTEGRTVFCLDFLNEIQLGAHYFIAPDGLVIRGCGADFRTPHVGKSEYLGREWLNETSIGIEFLADGVNTYNEFITRISYKDTFTDEQYEAGGQLIANLKRQFPSILSRVIGHMDVSGDKVRGKGRGKKDPGKNFDWEELAEEITTAESDS